MCLCVIRYMNAKQVLTNCTVLYKLTQILRRNRHIAYFYTEKRPQNPVWKQYFKGCSNAVNKCMSKLIAD